MENSKTQDIFTSDLVARPEANDSLIALGKYIFECFDKDGNLKWTAESKNLVVNVGLQYMAGTGLDGATTRITAWYVGLKSSGTPAASDTMSSHATWTEITTYSNATRPAATFAAATTANPSVVTNTASKATFNINGTTTVVGAFLTSDSTKSGTTGTLFSAGDFSSSRSVVNGDTLQVTYQFNLSA